MVTELGDSVRLPQDVQDITTFLQLLMKGLYDLIENCIGKS